MSSYLAFVCFIFSMKLQQFWEIIVISCLCHLITKYTYYIFLFKHISYRYICSMTSFVQMKRMKKISSSCFSFERIIYGIVSILIKHCDGMFITGLQTLGGSFKFRFAFFACLHNPIQSSTDWLSGSTLENFSRQHVVLYVHIVSSVEHFSVGFSSHVLLTLQTPLNFKSSSFPISCTVQGEPHGCSKHTPAPNSGIKILLGKHFPCVLFNRISSISILYVSLEYQTN